MIVKKTRIQLSKKNESIIIEPYINKEHEGFKITLVKGRKRTVIADYTNNLVNEFKKFTAYNEKDKSIASITYI